MIYMMVFVASVTVVIVLYSKTSTLLSLLGSLYYRRIIFSAVLDNTLFAKYSYDVYNLLM